VGLLAALVGDPVGDVVGCERGEGEVAEEREPGPGGFCPAAVNGAVGRVGGDAGQVRVELLRERGDVALGGACSEDRVTGFGAVPPEEADRGFGGVRGGVGEDALLAVDAEDDTVCGVTAGEGACLE
jgi:hypothetical protein